MGSKDGSTNEQTDVSCWAQNASMSEIKEYQKKGMSINRKVYFLVDPAVTERHEIIITEKLGVAVSGGIQLKVRSEAFPDAAAGMGVIFKVMCEERTGFDD